MSAQPKTEMTWTKATMIAVGITAILLVTLGFVPSIFRYWWASNGDAIAEFINNTTGIEFKDTYTLVRIHDAISMGYQTFAFAIPVVLTYIIGEKRRRRLGLRGAEPVKGYLPGK
ncbi:MAG: hypothetical protein ABIS18_00095 [Actinomycetota bacterium]